MNNPGVIVPSIPEKSPFGRFDNQFIQQRRLALENFMQKVAKHSILARDSDLGLFLESDTFSLDVRRSLKRLRDTELSKLLDQTQENRSCF